MNNSTTKDAKTIKALRDEMERAYDAATDAGALKRSQWWQDRKALLVALEAREG